jgi:hypothetical protein
MKLSGESANFEMDTGLITLGANETISLFRTQQVNMRTVLGEMMDKYEKFLIIFNSLGATTGTAGLTYTAGTITGQNQTAVWTLGLSGLDFICNTVNGQLSNIGYFPTRFNLPVNASLFENSRTYNGVMFVRPKNDVVTITAAPYLIRGGGAGIAVAPAAGATVDFNLSFTIYGLID